MSIDSANRACSIRTERLPETKNCLWEANEAVPPRIERAFIETESSSRAELFDVEPVDVGLEVHDEPSCFNDQDANDKAFTGTILIYEWR